MCLARLHADSKRIITSVVQEIRGDDRRERAPIAYKRVYRQALF